MIDKEAIENLMLSADEDVMYLSKITDEIISKYSNTLDDIMKAIYSDVILNKDGVEKTVLEQYYLELTNILYFMFEKLEQLGIYDDISKASAKEAYNNSYLSQTNAVTGKKPTVAEMSAAAEKDALYHTTVNGIYARSYKIFKSKIEAGYEMAKCLSKIISSRLADMQIATVDTDTKTQLLLERKFGN